MSISTTVGGVTKEITPSATIGGVVHEFDAVHANEGGVLYEIYSKGSSNELEWQLTGEDSYAELISVSNNGYTVKYKARTQTETSIVSNYITIPAGSTVTLVSEVTSSGNQNTCILRVKDENGNLAANELTNKGTTRAISTTGKYCFEMAGFGVSAGPSGATSYTATITATITIP